jgi:hypothetical protein
MHITITQFLHLKSHIIQSLSNVTKNRIKTPPICSLRQRASPPPARGSALVPQAKGSRSRVGQGLSCSHRLGLALAAVSPRAGRPAPAPAPRMAVPAAGTDPVTGSRPVRLRPVAAGPRRSRLSATQPRPGLRHWKSASVAPLWYREREREQMGQRRK